MCVCVRYPCKLDFSILTYPKLKLENNKVGLVNLLIGPSFALSAIILHIVK